MPLGWQVPVLGRRQPFGTRSEPAPSVGKILTHYIKRSPCQAPRNISSSRSRHKLNKRPHQGEGERGKRREKKKSRGFFFLQILFLEKRGKKSAGREKKSSHQEITREDSLIVATKTPLPFPLPLHAHSSDSATKTCSLRRELLSPSRELLNSAGAVPGDPGRRVLRE